jgi:hypothetical protein
MKSTDLRIGNLIEYQCYDELATPKEYWVENIVDLDDLLWLNKHESENYRPMEITEDILNRFGFEADGPGWYWLNKENRLTTVGVAYGMDNNIFEFEGFEIPIQYVHQLQNLYFALTGKELQEINQL